MQTRAVVSTKEFTLLSQSNQERKQKVFKDKSSLSTNSKDSFGPSRPLIKRPALTTPIRQSRKQGAQSHTHANIALTSAACSQVDPHGATQAEGSCFCYANGFLEISVAVLGFTFMSALAAWV